VGQDRVQRIWRREGLNVPKKQRPRGRLWLRDGTCVRLRAERANHVWSYDFVHHATHDGRSSATAIPGGRIHWRSIGHHGRPQTEQHGRHRDPSRRDAEPRHPGNVSSACLPIAPVAICGGSNQFRLLLASLAYVLMERLRTIGLAAPNSRVLKSGFCAVVCSRSAPSSFGAALRYRITMAERRPRARR